MDLQDQTNGKKGGQPGNNNAGKNRIFSDQLKRHLIHNPHKLEKIVEKLVDDAMEGNIAAAREVMDRVEGKAIATQEVTGPDGTQLKTAVQLFFVEPDGTITAD